MSKALPAKHVVAVSSGKGGVGKSTAAANIAACLANMLHLRVGLLDADVYTPSLPRMMNLSGRKPGVKQTTTTMTPLRETDESFASTERRGADSANVRSNASSSSFLARLWNRGVNASASDRERAESTSSTTSSPKKQIRSVQRLVPLVNHNVKCMSFGFLIVASHESKEGSNVDQAVAWRGPMASSALERMARDTDWGELDVIVVDMPPGTGDIHITTAQRLQLTSAIIVTTPQQVAVDDARRGAAMFRKLKVPILGVIENMSYFRCSGCGKEHDIFQQTAGTVNDNNPLYSALSSSLEARDDLQSTQIPLLCRVPIEQDVCSASDKGTPISLKDPESDAGKAYLEASRKLWEIMNKARTSGQEPVDDNVGQGLAVQ